MSNLTVRQSIQPGTCECDLPQDHQTSLGIGEPLATPTCWPLPIPPSALGERPRGPALTNSALMAVTAALAGSVRHGLYQRGLGGFNSGGLFCFPCVSVECSHIACVIIRKLALFATGNVERRCQHANTPSLMDVPLSQRYFILLDTKTRVSTNITRMLT